MDAIIEAVPRRSGPRPLTPKLPRPGLGGVAAVPRAGGGARGGAAALSAGVGRNGAAPRAMPRARRDAPCRSAPGQTAGAGRARGPRTPMASVPPKVRERGRPAAISGGWRAFCPGEPWRGTVPIVASGRGGRCRRGPRPAPFPRARRRTGSGPRRRTPSASAPGDAPPRFKARPEAVGDRAPRPAGAGVRRGSGCGACGLLRVSRRDRPGV